MHAINICKVCVNVAFEGAAAMTAWAIAVWAIPLAVPLGPV